MNASDGGRTSPNSNKVSFPLGEIAPKQATTGNEGTVTQQPPTETILGSNFPNPFNPTTTINYQLVAPGFVTLRIFNLLGEEISRLVEAVQDIGYYTAIWDANNSSSGIYYVRIHVVDESGNQSYQATRKLVLMK